MRVRQRCSGTTLTQTFSGDKRYPPMQVCDLSETNRRSKGDGTCQLHGLMTVCPSHTAPHQHLHCPLCQLHGWLDWQTQREAGPLKPAAQHQLRVPTHDLQPSSPARHSPLYNSSWRYLFRPGLGHGAWAGRAWLEVRAGEAYLFISAHVTVFAWLSFTTYIINIIHPCNRSNSALQSMLQRSALNCMAAKGWSGRNEK